MRFTENLKYLDVSVNKLSRDSAALLSGVIKKLDVLDLSHNRIQSEGAQNLAKSIEQNGGLQVLGLTKADIGTVAIITVIYSNTIMDQETQEFVPFSTPTQMQTRI